MLFHNPHIIYVALKRSMTQLFPPTLPQLTPFFFCISTPLLWQLYTGLVFGFCLMMLQKEQHSLQSKIKQLGWCRWNIAYLHQQKIWTTFQPFMLQILLRNASYWLPHFIRWWTKVPTQLVIIIATNLPTQGVVLRLWIHEEYLLAMFSKMVHPSRGISHLGSLSVQLFIIMYSQWLCSLHLLHKMKCCMILPSETLLSIQKVFVPSISSLWICEHESWGISILVLKIMEIFYTKSN